MCKLSVLHTHEYSVKQLYETKNRHIFEIEQILRLGQVWYLIVSIPDLCTITYF